MAMSVLGSLNKRAQIKTSKNQKLMKNSFQTSKSKVTKKNREDRNLAKTNYFRSR